MTCRLRVAWLPDGKRLHLRHGRLDSIIQAFGAPREVGRAYDAAIARANQLLPDLRWLAGPLAQRAGNVIAVLPAPLATAHAVSGALADELLEAMHGAARLDKAFANNAGTVRLHISEGHSFVPPQFDWPERPRFWTRTPMDFHCVSRGVCVLGGDPQTGETDRADRILVTSVTATQAEAAAASIAQAMAPSAAPRLLPFPPRPAPPNSAQAELLQRGQAHAEQLYAAGLLRVALISIAGTHALIAPPAFTVDLLR